MVVKDTPTALDREGTCSGHKSAPLAPPFSVAALWSRALTKEQRWQPSMSCVSERLSSSRANKRLSSLVLKVFTCTPGKR